MKAGESFFAMLRRLSRDARGNTLALVAAVMIPLAGLVGGGIDMSRVYLVKTRLQQACDAGALTGRKTMGSGAWSASSNAANTAATKMFDANFQSGAYGSGTMTRSFAESGGKVTGTASVPLPMTMMKIFGINSQTLAVTCDAEMRLPNTDVMFVLDTTGSMGDTNVGDTSNKITGLKKAVKCFYEALQKVDTTADCGSTPTTSNSSSVQIRFGFVPYSVNVNVGRLLPNSYMPSSWTYQSRTYSGGSSSSSTTWGAWTSFSNWGSCSGYTNSATTEYRNLTNGNFFGFAYCSGESRTGTTTTTTTTGSYTYQPVSQDISGLKAGGSSWNNSVNLPVGTNGASTAVTWDGCVEERQTVRNTDGDPSDEFSPIPSAALDMNIDLVPTSDTTTQWGPILPGAVWGRTSGGSNSYTNVTTTSDLARNYNYYCPVAARRLTSYPTASTFESYVDSLTPSGNTYHDIGLIWGARLLSPTGIFASDNAYTPSGGTIQRHLIFMTDGDTNTDRQDYTAYGVPWWDRRQTSTSSAPSNSLLDSEVDARFPALCERIKNMNITVWVVSYGAATSTDTNARLRACSSGTEPNKKYFSATTTATLISNFQQIADEISELRLTN